MIHLKNAINATTFTSHLLHSLQLESIIERIPKRSETKLRRFGYGLHYHRNLSWNQMKSSSLKEMY
jgi:hypothetical protein